MKFAFLAKSDCFDPKLPTKKNINGTNEVKHKKSIQDIFQQILTLNTA